MGVLEARIFGGAEQVGHDVYARKSFALYNIECKFKEREKKCREFFSCVVQLGFRRNDDLEEGVLSGLDQKGSIFFLCALTNDEDKNLI